MTSKKPQKRTASNKAVKVHVQERRKKVIELKEKNPKMTAEEIGKIVGASANIVGQDIYQARKSAAAEVVAAARPELERTISLLNRSAEEAASLIDNMKRRLEMEPRSVASAALGSTITGACRILVDVARRLESLYGLAAPTRVEAKIDVRVAYMVNDALLKTENAIMASLESDPLPPEMVPLFLERLGQFRLLLPQHMEEIERERSEAGKG